MVSRRKTNSFHVDRDGNAEIYIMNADGTGVKRLTNTALPEYDINWSPDGKFLMFISGQDDDAEIYILDTQTKKLRRITNNRFQDETLRGHLMAPQ